MGAVLLYGGDIQLLFILEFVDQFVKIYTQVAKLFLGQQHNWFDCLHV